MSQQPKLDAQGFPEKWPARYRLPAPPYPNVWQAGPVSTTLGDLGCCNDNGNSTESARLGGLTGSTTGLSGLGACPQTATVYIEDSAIPQWVWLIAAVWGGLMLLKKR